MWKMAFGDEILCWCDRLCFFVIIAGDQDTGILLIVRER